MSKAKTTVETIVNDERPIDSVESVAKKVGKQLQIPAEEAQTLVEEYVNMTTQETNQTVIETIAQKSGRPTGEYYDGQSKNTHAGKYSLPVLEDVDHPLVPELDFSYIPRDIFGRTDLELAVKAIADPQHSLLLVGETGVGKDVLIKKIAQETNWPVQRVNFGSGTTYEQLVGMHIPTEDGHFTHRSGVLKTCVENEYWFVADELNAAPPEATMPLHGLTEERQARELIVQETGEVIKPGDRFRFIATMNPASYAGTNTINRAFKTRFTVLEIPFLEPKAEIGLLMERTAIDQHSDGKAICQRLVKLANNIRQTSDTVQTPVSTRELIKICNHIMEDDGTQFMSPQSATKVVLKGAAMTGDWNNIQSNIKRFLGG